MKRHTFPVIGVLGIGLALFHGEVAAQDIAALQGTWQPVRLERKGEFVDDSFHPGARVLICEDRISFRVEEKTLIDMRFRIDPKVNPRHIDLICPAGNVLRGIYSLGDNRLILCWPLDADTPRPRMLLDSPDRDHATFTLQRVKR